MPIKQKDRNRKELVKAIVAQSNGKIFTVVAKRKSPKSYFVIGKLLQAGASINSIMLTEGDKYYLSTKKSKQMLIDLKHAGLCELSEHTEYFMEMTCRTGVKSQLKGGTSTIKQADDLVSVNLTNGKGYRCFSAYNVLEIRSGGAEIKFKEADVLAFEGE